MHSTAVKQDIAVFGESGSGKTVLLSSFYGATQQPEFWRSSHVEITAFDTGQGHRLLKNYNGMRDRAVEPAQTRYKADSYDFGVKLRRDKTSPEGSQGIEALHLRWHDYPGEWFEVSLDEEQSRRRLGTFRDLLSSDVALLLVDGQRLLDNAGDEERYLKTLFGSFRNGLTAIENELLTDGQPLVRFPRIWVLALSKADLHPNLDVYGLRDLIVDKALDDLNELRDVLQRFVESPEALDIGEDFVLLSSAKFEPDEIRVTERVGLDLVLPLAAVFPFERHLRWIEAKKAGEKVAEDLMQGGAEIAAVFIGNAVGVFAKNRKLGKWISKLLTGQGGKKAIEVAVSLAGDRLRARNAEAVNRRDFMSATLTQYRLDLEHAEAEGVLLRSRK